MLRQEREKARQMAALADDYLARGGTPTLCPPADAMADRFDPVREFSEAPRRREPAPRPAFSGFLVAALVGACAALVVRAMRRG